MAVGHGRHYFVNHNIIYSHVPTGALWLIFDVHTLIPYNYMLTEYYQVGV